VTDWMTSGVQDGRTITPDWMPIETSGIDGVVAKEIRNVPTGNGALTEIWRSEWRIDSGPVNQVFQRTIDPSSVSGWHAHAATTDRLFCATGRIRLSLYQPVDEVPVD